MFSEAKAGQERGECPVCHQTVATYVPKKGDGSQRNAYRHRDTIGYWCIGSNEEVPSASFGNPSRRQGASADQGEAR